MHAMQHKIAENMKRKLRQRVGCKTVPEQIHAKPRVEW